MKARTLILCSVCFLFLGAGNGFAQMTGDEALSKFVAAGMAYKEGQYDVAISRYREILEGGRTSGPAHYNLGNSYFKQGDRGRAVLSYERARRFIPRDSDLNFNYRYVQSQIDHYGDGTQRNFLGRAVENFTLFYTVDEMVIILVCAGIAIGIFVLVALYLNWSGSLIRGGIIPLTLLLIVYGAGLVAKVQFEKDSAIVITATESYFEPRTDSTVHFRLLDGVKIKILKSEGNWIKVRRLDGKIGWVSKDVLERI